MIQSLTIFWNQVPLNQAERLRYLWTYADLPIVCKARRFRRQVPTVPNWGLVCWSCLSVDATEWHHIIPISCGGSNVLQNFVKLCERCHLLVHVGHHRVEPVVFRSKIRTPSVPDVEANISPRTRFEPMSPAEAFVYSHRPVVVLADVPVNPEQAQAYMDRLNEESDRKAWKMWEFQQECEAQINEMNLHDREDFESRLRQAFECGEGEEYSPLEVNELWEAREYDADGSVRLPDPL